MGTQNRWIAYSITALIILVTITYSGAFKNGFVGWDDNDYVVENKLVRTNGRPDLKEIFTTAVSLNYHPLTILSLSLNDNSCKDCPNGISARPFILSNVILHALNTILVFCLMYLLFRKNLILAFLVAALFGVHPMHVESVAWISGRKDVLNSFFFLAGLNVYFFHIKAGRNKYLLLFLVFLLFVLACLSKATAVVFPVIVLLIEFLLFAENEPGNHWNSLRKIFTPRIILPLLPFFAVSVFIGLMAYNVQNGRNFLGMLQFLKDPSDVVNTVAPFSALQRIQIASYGFFAYAIKFLFPVVQSPYYPYPPFAEISHGSFSLLLWAALAGFIVTLCLVLYSLKRTKLFFFCYGFYLVNLALVLQFVSVGTAIIAERYTYLPYAGLAIIPAYFITGSSEKMRRILLGVTALFIVVMLIDARIQVKVWHDTESLWTQVIKRFPDSDRARSARGKYYTMLSSHAKNEKEKRILEDKAVADFNVAIKEKTMRSDVYEGAGVILISRNDPKNALQMLNVAIKLNPSKGRTFFNRAVVFDQLNQKENAIKDYESALSLSPEMALEILRNRSVLYIETGRYSDAIRDLDELIKIDGKEFTHYYNRAFSKLMLKDIDGAITDYRNVLRLNPGDKVTQEHLRVLLDAENNR